MSSFKININENSLYLNEGGAVIGDICFSTGDWFFPSESWDDFVVSLIYWLSHICIELAFDKNKTVEMRFMEGDFKISLTLYRNHKCTINFIEGDEAADQEEITHKTITFPFEEVKNEVKKACELLLKMKETKELDFEDDYEELKESYELLCKC